MCVNAVHAMRTISINSLDACFEWVHLVAGVLFTQLDIGHLHTICYAFLVIPSKTNWRAIAVTIAITDEKYAEVIERKCKTIRTFKPIRLVCVFFLFHFVHYLLHFSRLLDELIKWHVRALCVKSWDRE